MSDSTGNPSEISLGDDFGDEMSATESFNKASIRMLGWSLLAAGIYHWGGKYEPLSLVAAFGAGVSYMSLKVISLIEKEEAASPQVKPQYAAGPAHDR